MYDIPSQVEESRGVPEIKQRDIVTASLRSGMTGAVILAAGGSSRLGQPKQLLRFRGKSLVHHIVAAARQAGCSPVIVVIGSDSEKVTGELRSTSAVIVENENWQRGIGSSIRAGVQGLIDYAPEIDAVVLLVCDQPEVNADTIRNLVSAA